MGGNIISKLLNTIADNISKVINSGANVLVKFLSGIANNIGKVISEGANVIVKFVNGIGDNVGKVTSAGVNAIGKFITALGSAGVQLASKGADAVISFLNGVATTIRNKEPDMLRAGANVGAAIVQGMINGIGSLAGTLASKALSLITSLPGKVKKFLHIGSPSKVFYDIGVNIMLGLIGGIDDNADDLNTSMDNMIGSMVDTINAIPSLTGMDILNPTITPVVDLTGVQEGADQMNSIFAEAPVVAATSYGQAASISSSQTGQGLSDGSTSTEGSVIKFEQNNYSPESLSPVEIYRQTRNQLSQMRTALALA
jgi:phage-related protein